MTQYVQNRDSGGELESTELLPLDKSTKHLLEAVTDFIDEPFNFKATK